MTFIGHSIWSAIWHGMGMPCLRFIHHPQPRHPYAVVSSSRLTCQSTETSEICARAPFVDSSTFDDAFQDERRWRSHRMNSMSDSENPLKRIWHAPLSPTGFSLFCVTGCEIHPQPRLMADRADHLAAPASPFTSNPLPTSISTPDGVPSSMRSSREHGVLDSR
jgi:hypothetical protein